MTSENKRVFVTGISGFIGAHVLVDLLNNGYNVCGTVRSQKKADFIINKYSQHKENLEVVVVEDISVPRVFDKLVKDVSGIIHVASPVVFNAKDIKKEMVDPAVQLTQSVLEAASQSTNIKRVIIMSSIVTIYNYISNDPNHVYTEKDWNPMTFEQAVERGGHAGYSISKILAEKAAWEFMDQKKPKFDIVTLCPTWVFGPIEHQLEKLSEINESCKLVYDCITGKDGYVGLDEEQSFVDVRDVARVTRLAYETPKAANERYIVSSHSFTWQQVLNLTHQEFPEKTSAPKGNPSAPTKPRKMTPDGTKAIRDLGIQYLPKEATFRDSISQLISMQESNM